MADLDPVVATIAGGAARRRPDAGYSPRVDATPRDDLARTTLAGLDAIERAGVAGNGDERRCARCWRDRLTSSSRSVRSGTPAGGEYLMSPVPAVRRVFTIMPTATTGRLDGDRPTDVQRAEALTGYRAPLTEGRPMSACWPRPPSGPVLARLAEWIG